MLQQSMYQLLSMSERVGSSILGSEFQYSYQPQFKVPSRQVRRNPLGRNPTSTPPVERVHFNLGEDAAASGVEDDDKEQIHEVFCELAELDATNGFEWKETARWIKFEEDVEEGGERWSKPHVATLSLHSLFELRCSLLNPSCIVLFNVEALTIEQVADRVVEEYRAADPSINHEIGERIRDTVIQKHSHLYLRKKESGVLLRSLAEIGKKLSVSTRDIEKEGDDDANYGIGALLHPGGPGMMSLGVGNLGAFALGVSGVAGPVAAAHNFPSTTNHGHGHGHNHNHGHGHNDQHPAVGRLSSAGSNATRKRSMSAMQRAASVREHPTRQPHSHSHFATVSPVVQSLAGNTATTTNSNGPRTTDDLSPTTSKKNVSASGSGFGSASNLNKSSQSELTSQKPFTERRSRSCSRDSVNSSGKSSITRSQTSIHREGVRKTSTMTSIDDEASASAVKFDAHFMKKIPPGAEAANILVGEVDWLENTFAAFVRLNKAVLLGDLTEVPVPTRFIFILLGPSSYNQRYHEIGRSMATLMSDEIFREVAYRAKGREDLLVGIDEFLSNVTVLPPGEWDPSIRIEPPENLTNQARVRKTTIAREGNNESVTIMPSATKAMLSTEFDEEEDTTTENPLARTGKVFGGLRNDLRRRVKWYVSDFRDGLHLQCVATFVFLYFACLAPTITFGGMLDFELDGYMATLESIVSAGISGIIFSLTAGQPLVILGSTGPMLIFETILYTFAQKMGIDFMTFRLWVGLWTTVLLTLIVAFDLSFLVRYITRFTEESFSCLISLIFIVEAFSKLSKIATDNPIVYNAGELYAVGNTTLQCACVLSEPFIAGGCSNATDVQRRYYITRSTQPAGVNQCASNATDFYSYGNTTGSWNASSPGCCSTPVLTLAECKQRDGVLVGRDCKVPDYLPEVFFFSCLLFSGTFIISYGLKALKTSSFFTSVTRELISDFAVVIAIVSMSLTDSLVGLKTPKLVVPDSFKPTRNDRGWLIPLYTDRSPLWSMFAAVLPAVLAAILVFMDQQISAVIINRKENKLQKGVGYHLDLLMVGVLIAISSFLGIPWFVASTVPSINHVMALRKESACNAPGEKPKYLGCRENRATGLAIGVMTIFSVFLSGVLQRIPMAVLYGVFLFMGISSLNGVQLVTRISIMFQSQKFQPDLIWLRHVPLRRIHLFTVIQILGLAAMWTIKAIHETAIAFPLLVCAMCFIRKLMDKLFSQNELMYLDDIIPEEHKRRAEERRKSLASIDLLNHGENEKSFILDDGNVLSIKIDDAAKEAPKFSLTDSVNKTNIWKQLVKDHHGNASEPEKPPHSAVLITPTCIEPTRDSPNSSKRSSFSEERRKFLDEMPRNPKSDVDESAWRKHKRKLFPGGASAGAGESPGNGRHRDQFPGRDRDQEQATPNIIIYPSTPDKRSSAGRLGN